MEMLVAHVHEAVVPPRQIRPELPGDLEDVILTCLRKDPAERYPDVANLDRALAACEPDEPWDNDQAEAWWKEAVASGQWPVASEKTLAAGPQSLGPMAVTGWRPARWQ